MNRRSVLAWLALCGTGVIVACTSTTEGTGDPATAGGASASQVSACKGSCDKMKFFGCNSAPEQALCYSECDGATGGQIEVFNACAGNSICDPECRTSIKPNPSGSGSGTASSGGGATATSCNTACGKLIECNLITLAGKSECLSQCTQYAYQYQIDCVVGTACATLIDQCGDPREIGSSSGETSSSGTTSSSSSSTSGGASFEVTRCQSACDGLQFFDCIDAGQLSACRNLCTTAPAAKRDAFTSCGNGAGSDCVAADDCLTIFKQ